MSRIHNLNKMKFHPVLKNLFQKLTVDEYSEVQKFVKEREHLDNNKYAEDANRWYLGKPKPKHYSDMWAIVSQCSDIEIKPRRR